MGFNSGFKGLRQRRVVGSPVRSQNSSLVAEVMKMVMVVMRMKISPNYTYSSIYT